MLHPRCCTPVDSPCTTRAHATRVQAETERLGQQKSLLAVLLNINSVLTDAASAMVDDSFLRCFTSASPDPWNWNFYLAPMWCVCVCGARA